MKNKKIDFHKLLNNIISSKDSVIWSNNDSSLQLISINNDFPHRVLEAEFNSIKKPKERLLEFYNVIEWLRKNPQISNITPYINARLDKGIGSELCEWQYLDFSIEFTIEGEK